MQSLGKIFIIIIFFCFIYYQALLAQDKEEKGKIEQFEEELERGNDKNETKKSREFKNEDEEEGSSFFGWIIGDLIVKPLLFGLLIGSSDDDASPYSVNLWNNYFSDYPYKSQNIGLYSSPETSNKRFAMKLFGNYFYHSADLQGFDMRARIFPFPFLGIALDFTD
ncbi:MAG: hypothetical protein JSW07_14500, partial [bacterium]